MSKTAKYRPELSAHASVPEYIEWLYAGAAIYEREALRIANPRLRYIHRSLAQSRRVLAHLLSDHGTNKVTEDHAFHHLEEAWSSILGVRPFKPGPLPDATVRRNDAGERRERE